MQEHKTTQRKLADAIEMRPQTVSLYATGQSNPDIDGLKKIAEFFDVSADYLLGISDVRTPDSSIRAMAEALHLSETAIQVICNMAYPDNLGGDPEILYALNAMLEGLAPHDDTDGYTLLDISNYLKFTPIPESKITDALEDSTGVPRKVLAAITNGALKNQLLQEIEASLKHLKEKYYKHIEN